MEARHLAPGDYDEKQFTSDCGSTEEHISRNTCPKKHGEVGDCHYELYVQQDIEADDEDEAYKKSDIGKLIDEYLQSLNITEFDSADFDYEIIGDRSDNNIKQFRIVHENVYYNNE
jgi:hypothetical protein